jgi:hypothetical protein
MKLPYMQEGREVYRVHLQLSLPAIPSCVICCHRCSGYSVRTWQLVLLMLRQSQRVSSACLSGIQMYG